ncbi:MAG: response regulator [Opitutales bacterium]|nr:response regulator [Opitutales bacterium]
MKNKVRIFVVEDEEIVALDLQATLRDLGYGVAGHTGDAEKAVRLVSDTRPDLVLMDINLKNRYDGIHAARQIRADANIPVIFVTAYDDESTIVQAQVTEPYGYLLKPFNSREIHICIQMALFHHTMQRERERMRAELQAALLKSDVPLGIITVCASCRKARDKDGQWVELETFLENHTRLRFSHGCCSACEDDFYRTPLTGPSI